MKTMMYAIMRCLLSLKNVNAINHSCSFITWHLWVYRTITALSVCEKNHSKSFMRGLMGFWRSSDNLLTGFADKFLIFGFFCTFSQFQNFFIFSSSLIFIDGSNNLKTYSQTNTSIFQCLASNNLAKCHKNRSWR
jgi:hypothetical protein